MLQNILKKVPDGFIIIVTRVTKEDKKINKYYFISYNLPSEPSRIRVSVWRWLKKIGALNMQQSLWLLPDCEHALETLNSVKESIEKDGGAVYIVSGEFVHGEEDIIKRFMDDRESEYKELMEYCKKFHEEMAHETEVKNFTFAELEENDEEYKKLCSWYEKIKKRDLFKPPLRQTVDEEMAKCSEEFQEFSDRVYEYNN